MYSIEYTFLYLENFLKEMRAWCYFQKNNIIPLYFTQ